MTARLVHVSRADAGSARALARSRVGVWPAARGYELQEGIAVETADSRAPTLAWLHDWTPPLA